MRPQLRDEFMGGADEPGKFVRREIVRSRVSIAGTHRASHAAFAALSAGAVSMARM